MNGSRMKDMEWIWMTNSATVSTMYDEKLTNYSNNNTELTLTWNDSVDGCYGYTQLSLSNFQFIVILCDIWTHIDLQLQIFLK